MSIAIPNEMPSYLLQRKTRRSTIGKFVCVLAAICLLWNAVPSVYSEEPSSALSQVRPGGIADTSLDAKVESLLRTMTLDEAFQWFSEAPHQIERAVYGAGRPVERIARRA